jgi:hypothetical protein
MKKSLFIIIAALVFIGCSSTKMTPQQKAEKTAKMAQYVRDAAENRKFTVEIDYMTPQRGGMRHLDYGFELRVSGDSIYSYLPFLGRAWQVPYGGGKGLWFEDIIRDYSVNRVKKDCLTVKMIVVNEEDRYLYILSLFNNGSADLSVFSQNRDNISYNGKLVFDK